MVPASTRFQGFLFDLDGTLLDTAPDLLAALNHLLRKNYKPELVENDIRGAISDGSNGLIQLALGIDSSAPEFNSLKLEFLDYYRLNLFQNTRPFPGIQEILIKIEQSKRPWGIVTSKLSSFTIPLVEHFGWNLRAKCVVCGDTLKQNKPHPAPLLEGANYLGLPPNECLYIGDAITDVQASKAAGMQVVTAGYGYLPDDKTAKTWDSNGFIESPYELEFWLQ